MQGTTNFIVKTAYDMLRISYQTQYMTILVNRSLAIVFRNLYYFIFYYLY
jgi:hypothetical protein